MAKDTKESALELLAHVERLAKEGHNQKEIAKALGFNTTFTLNNRLVKASQLTNRAVPPFRPHRGGKNGLKHVETVEVKRRGKGSAYGVNVPQEPLSRAGLKPGDRLRLSVRGRTITLSG